MCTSFINVLNLLKLRFKEKRFLVEKLLVTNIYIYHMCILYTKNYFLFLISIIDYTNDNSLYSI